MPGVPRMSAPLIEARGLGLSRGGRRLLADVSLAVEPGQVLTLVGPNGAGKSTLLKALIGLSEPSAGELRRRDGLRVGYVPQYFQVDPNLPLTTERFLTLQLGRPTRPLAEVAESTRVAHLLARPLQVLSGGELRRVLLARALLREPHLLALDEPAAGLDLPGQTEIYELIQRLRQRYGCGALVVSHDLHLVMAATDQVLCLSEGHIACRGTPEKVMDHPEYRALFGAGFGPALGIFSHHHGCADDHAHPHR